MKGNGRTMVNIYRGNMVHTPECGRVQTAEHSYMAVSDGKIIAIYPVLPDEYEGLPVTDFGEQILIPGFNDIHLHAGQFPNMGIGYSGELIQWIEQYAYDVEQSMCELDHARKCYVKLIDNLWNFGITRSVILGTHQKETNVLLYELLEQSGLASYTGKSVCDRSPTGQPDESPDTARNDMLYFTENYRSKQGLVRFILSATYVPGCTPESMELMGSLARQYGLCVTSHLCENHSEVEEVSRLHPEHPDYASVYRHYHLLGDTPTIMAHCIHTTEHEKQLLKDCGVWVAHCPLSNFNLSSGIMPLREYLDRGIKVGLGSDIAAGHTLSMMQNMTGAIQASKMYWVEHPDQAPITTMESFYLATRGGGSFFGNVGSFEPGFEFDALVIDDSSLYDYMDRSLWERIERFIYRGDERQIVKRFVGGNEVIR